MDVNGSDKNRLWASAAFAGVLLVLGVPLWWKTTEVYRVALPYGKISALNDLPFTIRTHLTILANDESTAGEIRGLVEESFNKKDDILQVNITTQVLSEELRKALTSTSEDRQAAAQVARSLPDEETGTNHLVLAQRSRLTQQVWVSKERVVLFKDIKATTTIIKTLERAIWESTRRRLGQPTPQYDIALVVVVPDPRHQTTRFDAHTTVMDYLGPFADEMSILHNFTLQSQWVHMLELDFQAKQIPDSSPWGRHFAVSAARLPHVITPLESRLAHVSRNAALHLVLYMLPCERAPLWIYTDHNKRVGAAVDAFISPRWGGVVLASPDFEECSELLNQTATTAENTPDERQIMGVFVAQLRQLLGIHTPNDLENTLLDPLTSVSPRSWEVDNLLRLRTLEYLTSAKLTLQSLAQLLGEISNIVITDEVGASVVSSLELTEQAATELARGDLLAAHRHAQSAFLHAESAFTHPSLLALLYFPDDQKYAVYIPLFLPVMIPVIISLNNIWAWIRGKQINKEKID